MKNIRENRQAPQQADVVRIQHVARDFLKMLAAAIICGLAVSFAAAAVTLLLTGNAEARLMPELEDTVSAELLPTPGELLLGDGCDRILLNAIERDWQVRIDGKHVEVRVMQTFQLPVEPAEVATFHVQLIHGARMQSIAAQSSTADWTGQVISADEYERLTPDEYLSLSRNRLLASHSPQGTVMTSPFLGLKVEELVTIEYTYVMALDAPGGVAEFDLPLETVDKFAAGGRPADDEDDILSSRMGRAAVPTTAGAVWVEWIGNKPSRVMGLPADADLEFSKSRIEGFSWETREIQPGARLQIAWRL